MNSRSAGATIYREDTSSLLDQMSSGVMGKSRSAAGTLHITSTRELFIASYEVEVIVFLPISVVTYQLKLASCFLLVFVRSLRFVSQAGLYSHYYSLSWLRLWYRNAARTFKMWELMVVSLL